MKKLFKEILFSLYIKSKTEDGKDEKITKKVNGDIGYQGDISNFSMGNAALGIIKNLKFDDKEDIEKGLKQDNQNKFIIEFKLKNSRYKKRYIDSKFNTKDNLISFLSEAYGIKDDTENLDKIKDKVKKDILSLKIISNDTKKSNKSSGRKTVKVLNGNGAGYIRYIEDKEKFEKNLCKHLGTSLKKTDEIFYYNDKAEDISKAIEDKLNNTVDSVKLKKTWGNIILDLKHGDKIFKGKLKVSVNSKLNDFKKAISKKLEIKEDAFNSLNFKFNNDEIKNDDKILTKEFILYAKERPIITIDSTNKLNRELNRSSIFRKLKKQ